MCATEVKEHFLFIDFLLSKLYFTKPKEIIEIFSISKSIYYTVAVRNMDN